MTEPLQRNDSGPQIEGRYKQLHSVLPHRLHVTEFMQAEMGKLAAKTTLLHTAKGHFIAGAVTIDKHPTALQLAREFIRKRGVGGEDRSREAKVAVVCQRQGVLSIFRGERVAATGPNSSGGRPSSMA